ATLGGHSGKVKAVAFSPTGGFLVSTSWDETLKFWDAETGALQRSLAIDCGWGLTVSPHGRFVVCSGGKVIDAPTRREILEHGPSTGHHVAVSPDSRLAVTSDNNKAIHVWELSTGKSLAVLGSTGRSIAALGFSADGCTLAWGTHWTRKKENDRG